MIKVENYPNAYKEVYVILNNMEESTVKSIPQDFMDMIKTKMNADYQFELQPDVDFQNQDLLRETKAILSYIFINYWATDEQKNRIDEVFKQDLKKEEVVKEQYNSEDIFKNIRAEEKNKEETQLSENKKENIIRKLINKLKNLFKR